MHLRDVRAGEGETRKQHLSFLNAVRSDIFTMPGDGAIGFLAIFKTLEEAGSVGWLVVKANQNLAKANRLE